MYNVHNVDCALVLFDVPVAISVLFNSYQYIQQNSALNLNGV